MPILLLANIGVLAATLFTGLAIHWVFKLPLMIALLFGSIISATDPISVLSVFEEEAVQTGAAKSEKSRALTHSAFSEIEFLCYRFFALLLWWRGRARTVGLHCAKVERLKIASKHPRGDASFLRNAVRLCKITANDHGLGD